jgi:hypothetical protein
MLRQSRVLLGFHLCHYDSYFISVIFSQHFFTLSLSL